MGCTGITVIDDPQMNIPIKTNYLTLKTPEINTKFICTVNNLKSIEKIRDILINKRNKIIYITGNCSTINNTLQGILYSFLLFLSTKSDGDISTYQVYFNIGQEPFFSLSNCDENDKIISKEINDYIYSLLKIEEIILKEKNIYYNCYYDFIRNNNTYKSLLIQNNEELNNYQENLNILKYIGENKILEELYNIFKIDDEYLSLFPCDLEDNNYINSINEVGKNMKNKGYKTIYDISFYGVEPKYRFGSSPNEGKILYEEKMKSYI